MISMFTVFLNATDMSPIFSAKDCPAEGDFIIIFNQQQKTCLIRFTVTHKSFTCFGASLYSAATQHRNLWLKSREKVRKKW